MNELSDYDEETNGYNLEDISNINTNHHNYHPDHLTNNKIRPSSSTTSISSTTRSSTTPRLICKQKIKEFASRWNVDYDHLSQTGQLRSRKKLKDE